MEWMRSWPKGWYSPLHLACKHGHEQIIWTLLEHGAKWSLADKVSWSNRGILTMPKSSHAIFVFLYGLWHCRASERPCSGLCERGKPPLPTALIR